MTLTAEPTGLIQVSKVSMLVLIFTSYMIGFGAHKVNERWVRPSVEWVFAKVKAAKAKRARSVLQRVCDDVNRITAGQEPAVSENGAKGSYFVRWCANCYLEIEYYYSERNWTHRVADTCMGCNFPMVNVWFDNVESAQDLTNHLCNVPTLYDGKLPRGKN